MRDTEQREPYRFEVWNEQATQRKINWKRERNVKNVSTFDTKMFREIRLLREWEILFIGWNYTETRNHIQLNWNNASLSSYWPESDLVFADYLPMTASLCFLFWFFSSLFRYIVRFGSLTHVIDILFFFVLWVWEHRISAERHCKRWDFNIGFYMPMVYK